MDLDPTPDKANNLSWVDLTILDSATIELHDELAASTKRKQLGRTRREVRHSHCAVTVLSRKRGQPRPDSVGV